MKKHDHSHLDSTTLKYRLETGTDLDGAVNDDDTARTDRLYRRSGLFVEKWDRPLGEYPYGQVTIHNAPKKRSMRSS